MKDSRPRDDDDRVLTDAGNSPTTRVTARLERALKSEFPMSGSASDEPCRGTNLVFATAFGPGSTAVAFDIGEGLSAVKRTSERGDVHVLCVANRKDTTRSFAPLDHLELSSPSRLRFLSGEVETYSTSEHYLMCSLRAFREVWLGAQVDEARQD